MITVKPYNKNIMLGYECMEAGGRAMQEQRSGVLSDNVTP